MQDYPDPVTTITVVRPPIRSLRTAWRRRRCGLGGHRLHTKQRVCCAATYQQNDPTQVRRQAEWHTYEGLVCRLHSTVSEILQRADRARADALYVGPMSTGGADLLHHHRGGKSARRRSRFRGSTPSRSGFAHFEPSTSSQLPRWTTWQLDTADFSSKRERVSWTSPWQAFGRTPRPRGSGEARST